MPFYFLQFAAVATVGCAADLVTKWAVFRWLGMPGHSRIWWIWEGYIGIETSLNEGALFGIGQGKVALFAGFSAVAVVGILFWLGPLGGAHDRFLRVTLGIISGGILGNLYDRLGLWQPPDATGPIYAVRDWIRLSVGHWVWPNFNLADAMLVCGAAALLWHAWQFPPEPVVQEDAANGKSKPQ